MGPRRRITIGIALLGLAFVACDSEPKRKRSSDDDEAPGAGSARLSPADKERAALQRHLATEASALLAEGSASADTPRSASTRSLRGSSSRQEFGMIGLLNSGAGGDPDAPTAPWGRDDALPSGSGSIGTTPPGVATGSTSVAGRLPPEVIQRIVRQNFGRFRLCYENGLRNNPNLRGRVSISFTIGRDGTVGNVSGGGDLPDSGVVGCVTRAFSSLTFPQPEGGVVKVNYPIVFSPGDDTPARPAKAPKVNGKTLPGVTWQDVKTALEKAGCTEVERIEDASLPTTRRKLRAKKDGKLVTILLVSGETPLRVEVDALAKVGAVFEDGTFLLSISIDGDADRSSAQKLLDAVVVK